MPGDPPPAGAPWLRAGIAVGVPTAAFGVHALLYGRWIVDDAAITFAYVRSIATGAGPVLQPGADPVEGFSNPAWLGLLVLGRWLGLFDRGAWFGVPDYVAFPKLLALVLVAGVFACCYAVAKAMTPRPELVAIAAGLVTAAVPSFVIWTVSGLENALLALAAAGIAAVLVRAVVADRLWEPATAVWCGLLAALAALTRPDGLVYAGAFPLAALLLLHRADLGRAVRAAALSLLVSAVPVVGYLAWRLAVFGEYLPNTAIAKAQGLPGLSAATRPGELVTYVGWPAALLAVAAVGVVLARPGPARRALVALLVPLALAVVAFGVLAPDWMGQLRFATRCGRSARSSGWSPPCSSRRCWRRAPGSSRRCSRWERRRCPGWRSSTAPGRSAQARPPRCASSRRTPVVPSTPTPRSSASAIPCWRPPISAAPRSSAICGSSTSWGSPTGGSRGSGRRATSRGCAPTSSATSARPSSRSTPTGRG
ncbi:hypothetical protein BJF90_06785 [Pseudonocardia sp. CNS-004]|nr:hypothetical protein BJF90_06785 [Pseudonocardia sp. CNS-004]